MAIDIQLDSLPTGPLKIAALEGCRDAVEFMLGHADRLGREYGCKRIERQFCVAPVTGEQYRNAVVLKALAFLLFDSGFEKQVACLDKNSVAVVEWVGVVAQLGFWMIAEGVGVDGDCKLGLQYIPHDYIDGVAKPVG